MGAAAAHQRHSWHVAFGERRGEPPFRAVAYGPDQPGKFFASNPKEMTGALHEMQIEHFDNPDARRPCATSRPKSLEASTTRRRTCGQTTSISQSGDRAIGQSRASDPAT
jgi:hypothetical protein